MTQTIIRSSLDEALDELTRFLADPQTLPAIGQGVEILAEALQSGHKVMSCGNGGSLCDATHFAEELTGRFRKSRRPLPAMSVNDPAYFTCVGNDYSFDVIFRDGLRLSAGRVMSLSPSARAEPLPMSSRLWRRRVGLA